MRSRWVLLLISVLVFLAGCGSEQEVTSPHKASPESMVDESFLQKAATGIAYFRENSVKEPKDAEEAEFVEHVDGDTAKLKIDGKVETVRFLLIDTPETKHPELGEQPMGKKASDFTKNILEKAKRSHWNMTWRRRTNTVGFWPMSTWTDRTCRRSFWKKDSPGWGMYTSPVDT
ncbi:nuclease-like protein [Planifilum fimeticola]|uniref:Nuclease-like protein n=1 Tax=Planifilum fimeticola TaxID=201975 RepID=A0A2T0LAP9_9BACL|nr:thermonuclease family protein [Planifilum fimeticola]PRX38905.1 nuclease-like protein [Planifilum fimeticola]